ncbi:sodium-dependent transporter [candidate division KSB1 bacterium]
MELRKPTAPRETFTTNFGLLMTMIGVAVGLGNVWRFPYMVGRFGGAAFVLFYVAAVLLIGIPALMAEWVLGRHTGRGPLGAFERGGLPGGKLTGYVLFFVVLCATGYYSTTVGWVCYYALSEISTIFSGGIDPSAILPPDEGFSGTSFSLQLIMTPLVILTCGVVLVKGLRRGIERISKLIIPTLLFILIVLIIRAVTLENAGAGISWYIGGFRISELKGSVMAAALGQAIFSMSLGGTFMVIYGSYLDRTAEIPRNALFTGLGDTAAGLLAGLAIFPAVFAFGLQPDSGPSLIFFTLPRTFALMPAGWLFGMLFFLGLFGAAFLSDVAAFEVLVGGIVDNTGLTRRKAVWLLCGVVMVLAVPPMINMKIFIPWDLLFGSGMQTVGALLSVVTTAWCINRSDALRELGISETSPLLRLLYIWMRFVIPAAVVFVGINWLLDSVFGITLFG